MEDKKNLLRNLPGVDKILEQKEIKTFLEKLPRSYVVEVIRQILDETRKEILSGNLNIFKSDQVIRKIKKALDKNTHRSLQRVINATGIILHTNLGRAFLSESAQAAVQNIIKGYSNLEFNLQTGKRGSRYSHVEDILCKITGAESALVVNNNAAAVMLVLGTLAKDREVIVSRGQLVEIGGSFRVPDVMSASGAKLVEVGTTNKTYISDYENAITENTALLLKVHTSNFRVVGFTNEATSEELVNLGRRKGLPVFEDLGSGFLVELFKWGITDEPTVQQSIKSGIDVVSFSGDKLLGGPQAGIIVGKKVYVDKMKKNPLTRALRVDKMTIAALEATLWEYLDSEKVVRTNPTLALLTMDKEKLHEKALKLKGMLEEALESSVSLAIEKGFSKAGGGSLPLQELPTYLVTLVPQEITVETAAAKLRDASIPVVTRIIDDKLAFDPRTITDEEMSLLVQSVKDVITP
ncbi:MAG: L-seryl-tRNA(Ser) seleniumtransferase [Clostridia bacterium]|nr:L-seryl-tRNA(Sec) selenium transferase [Clostridiales bacterium]MDK2984392.1 L-seryl-tRNA(Ser) seleniumtransferase [Clostridia bacterium]